MSASRLRKFLSWLWVFPAVLAIVPVLLVLQLVLRPTWPIGTIVIDSPAPITAPLSGEEVCGWHMYVEHPGGSTGTKRTWAEPIVVTAPDGTSGSMEVRFDLPRPDFATEEGATQASTPGEILVATGSDRVYTRCHQGPCTWTEHLIGCGSRHEVRWHSDDGVVYVERAEPGLERAASFWIFAIALVFLALAALLLRLFRLKEPA